MIRVADAVIGYGATRFVTAVNGVNLTIRENEILGIAGESGSGKSTLMRAIYGDFSNGLRIQSGTISGEFTDPQGGAPVTTDSTGMKRYWWDKVSYVPQGSMSVLNPLMRVEKQLIDGLPARERHGTRSELRQRLAHFLNELGLEEAVLDAYPHQLSGGMRQRVLVAIAAFVNPRLILADEPTTALDVVVQKRILLMLVEIQRRLRNSLVLVSHDLACTSRSPTGLL
jgi:peptide/nickel transport system ATP-binding protein